MEYSKSKPYNSLPLLPPNADIESVEILKKCISARAALAELKHKAELIPNSSVLINTIPLLEAKDSSEVENIVTTTDKLFEFNEFNQDKADSATKETMRYRQALSQGYNSIKTKPICTRMAVEICQTIHNTNIDIRKTPGTKLKNPLTGEIIYTPPEGESVIREKLANWEKFLNERTDIDPLIRMAITHYQFEAIHPFTDGNGRTGRILNILFLVQEGLLDIPVLYLSRYFLNNKSNYYTLLRAVTEKNNWRDWILYNLDAIEQTAIWTNRKIEAIKLLLDHTCQYIKQHLPKIYSRDIVDIIFTQPYCRSINLVKAKIAKRQTAAVYLKQLVKIGILKEVKSGREVLFIHPNFIDLLTNDSNSFEEYK